MATRAQPIRFGPWPGGLNIYSDPTAVGDEDAVDLTNFDVDLDGSLKSRPPITVINAGIGARYNNRILGIFSLPTGVHYLLFSSTDAAGANPSTNYYNINTGAFGTIASTFAATAMAQHLNKAWLISDPGQAVNGGSWDGTTFTTIATIPKGCTVCIYKNRMFVGTGDTNTTNQSLVYWSAGNDPSTWVTSDNFPVSNGDGQGIRRIYSYQGSIVIFKNRSTYVYAYESDPSKGQTQQVSATIGTDGLDCLTENDGSLYVVSTADLYAISNWTFERVNIKVPFKYVDTHVGQSRGPISLSSIGDRVVVRYYDSYYIFNVKTRTFSQWSSQYTPGMFYRSPLFDTASGIDTYLSGNYLAAAAGPASNMIFKFKDGYTANDRETYTATVKTKVYSMNVPYSFKRLMWWGVDLLAKSNVIATSIPVTYGLATYWKDLPPRTWADMAPGTWGAPLDISISVSDNSDIKNAKGTRMFVKYLKSLRFRQVQFVLSTTLDGSTDTGPFQVYSITGFVINKQLVPKKIN